MHHRAGLTGLAVGSTVFSAILVSATPGLILPFLFRRIGIDPAVGSGPLATAANDSIRVAVRLSSAMIPAG